MSPTYLKGTFVKRYKRFFVDIVDQNAQQITLHCPNTGAMTGLVQEGWPVLYTLKESGKLAGTIHAIRSGRTWVGVNTLYANRLAEDYLLHTEMLNPQQLQREAKYDSGTRFDFKVLSKPQWIEVKSVTLAEKNYALFPDAPSTRALKHLQVFEELVHKKQSVRLIFVIQRGDCTHFKAASAVDPKYSQALAQLYIKAKTKLQISALVYQWGPQGAKLLNVLEHANLEPQSGELILSGVS